MQNQNMSQNSSKITRTFIAINFPQEIIKEIARIQSSLSSIKFIGKTTEIENLHLTLKFLGEITLQQREEVKSRLSKINLPSFQTEIGSLGIFTHKKSPKILWIKINSLQLNKLQKTIDRALSPLFPKEKRFMSHLTIARIKHVKDIKEFTDYINSIPIKKLFFKISEFKLFSSELKPFGPIYSEIKSYKLI